MPRFSGRLRPRYFLVVISFIAAIIGTWQLARMYNRYSLTNEIVLQLDSAVCIANLQLIRSNKELATLMEEKSKKLEMAERVAVWKPFSDNTFMLTENILRQLQSLQDTLTLAETSQKLVSQNVIRMRDSLDSFAIKIINVLPKEKQANMPALPFFNLSHQPGMSRDIVRQLLELVHFPESRMVSAICNKLKFEILYTANMVSQYCNDNVVSYFCGYDRYSALFSQNSTILKAGDTLEINTGIGAFSSLTKAAIFIEGKEQQISDNGYASFNKIVYGSGKQSVRIDIMYRDPSTGAPIQFQKSIQYTVVSHHNNSIKSK